ncbi:MAG: site-specific integrase [Rhizobiaceae bacterium]|nr:site-specific integrase [Rhizobiaceae bacterium]
MPKTNLTAASVDRLKPPPNGQVEYYDRRLPAFGLRLSHKGTKAWFVMTRINGKLARLTLGRYPALSLADARQKAGEAIDLTAAGKDPRLIKAAADEERQQRLRNTFSACASEFMRLHAERRLRPSTQREYRRLLFGPDTNTLHDRPISHITKRDVLDVIETIDARGSPAAASRTRAYLSKFFNWCAERDIIETVPTDRIPAPNPEVKRDRVLDATELRYLLRALNQEVTAISKVIRILLLTGQRRSEVAGMRWSELDRLDGAEATWQIPGSRTKNGESHLVPLSPPVVDLISAMPRTNSDLVFTTTGDTPVSGFGKFKAHLDRSINELRAKDDLGPMPHWRIHDLRRTMVTLMNERLAVPPHIVEAVVNHISGLAKAGVAGVYNRALYIDDRRKALEAWGHLIDDNQR